MSAMTFVAANAPENSRLPADSASKTPKCVSVPHAPPEAAGKVTSEVLADWPLDAGLNCVCWRAYERGTQPPRPAK